MKHYKPLVCDLIHEVGRIGDVEVNEFFFDKVDPNGVDQLYDEILNGCIFLFIFFSFEESVLEEEVMWSFNDKSIDILLVDECSNKGDSSFESCFDCSDCLNEGFLAATD
jgi:hypothetical protein